MTRDDDDDDDEFHRQETIVEKSDRMAREISARREIRLREERVRLLTDQPQKKKRSRSRPNPQAPVIHTTTVPVSPPDPDVRDTDPDREPRLSDPFPPLQQRQSGSRPQPAPSRPAQRAPERTPAHLKPPSQMDVLAVELEELIRGFRAGWRKSPAADKAALIASTMTLAGVLAPWITDPAHPLQLGLTSGGIFHAALSIAAVLIVVGTSRAFDGLRAPVRDRDHTRRYRRGGLWLVLLGASSTMLCVFFLIYWSLSKGADWPIDIHPGFYWTLAWGTGVSYGGYARFGAPSSME